MTNWFTTLFIKNNDLSIINLSVTGQIKLFFLLWKHNKWRLTNEFKEKIWFFVYVIEHNLFNPFNSFLCSCSWDTSRDCHNWHTTYLFHGNYILGFRDFWKHDCHETKGKRGKKYVGILLPILILLFILLVPILMAIGFMLNDNP